ncbi:Uncharacterised protein [Citrobacter youngae]|uniref:Uncharacterized protein n=1 Tax=Citrobacter youngae TaxID=133448 RepID=A0ABN7GV19_9ENTR|nr:Uncharacterised protein [Citrobacter youngae]
MQGVLLQDFTHHFRDRFVYEEAMRAELFIQQGEIRLNDDFMADLVARPRQTPEMSHHAVDEFHGQGMQ